MSQNVDFKRTDLKIWSFTSNGERKHSNKTTSSFVPSTEVNHSIQSSEY
ncbi:MAG: hypothetical protein ACTS4Y_01010 [Candidatus Hodgkinia cicadicola]